MITSGKDITVVESFSLVNILSVDCTNKLVYIPLKIFLEYILTINTKILAKCIESRFCGDSLPTSIEDCHVVVTNLSDLVAMKANNRNASFGIKVNSSIARCPVLVRLNSGSHLLFDLTHVW